MYTLHTYLITPHYTYLLLGRPLLICVFNDGDPMVLFKPSATRRFRRRAGSQGQRWKNHAMKWKALVMGIQSNNSDIIYRYLYIHCVYNIIIIIISSSSSSISIIISIIIIVNV